MVKEHYGTIDEYIRSFPKEAQAVLQKIRRTIKKAASRATETMSYGIPTFDMKGEHLVHFAAFKNHIGFYPTLSGIAAFKKELSQYKGAKGSVQFPTNAVPFALVEKIVAFRLAEVLEKRTGKPAKHDPANEDLEEALKVISSMIHKIEKAGEHFAPGTSQYTLARKRLAALRIASALIKKSLIHASKKTRSAERPC